MTLEGKALEEAQWAAYPALLSLAPSASSAPVTHNWTDMAIGVRRPADADGEVNCHVCKRRVPDQGGAR